MEKWRMELGWVKNIDKLEEALSLERVFSSKKTDMLNCRNVWELQPKEEKKAIIIWLSFVSCRIQWGYEVIERPCAMAT